jgi:hypothetical protein
MSLEKKKLYGIAVQILSDCQVPTSIWGFDVKAILWNNLLKLPDEKARFALAHLRDLVASI